MEAWARPTVCLTATIHTGGSTDGDRHGPRARTFLSLWPPRYTVHCLASTRYPPSFSFYLVGTSECPETTVHFDTASPQTVPQYVLVLCPT